MKVEQAIYGEVRGGHSLRGASNPGSLPAELASRLDLPDTAPPGVDWSPYVSGFPYADHYILARTFADPTASRAGMVLSHALIVPLAELALTADLRTLFSLLITAPQQPDVLSTQDISPSNDPPGGAIDLVAASVALTARGTGPVVRLGTAGFEDLVAALWYRLWPELRVRFAFRLSFSPHDVVETPKPSLVCTPAALSSRWTGYRIVESSVSVPPSGAAAILSGDAHAESILAFARDIGAELGHLNELPPLERAYEISFARHASFSDCVSAVRLVDRLSPDPNSGFAGKSKLVDRLDSRLEHAKADDILLLRNLSASGLSTTTKLWATLEFWVRNNTFSSADDSSMLSAIDDALSDLTAIKPWRDAVLGGIVSASRSNASAFPAAFWRWAHARPTLLSKLAERLPQDKSLESRLINALPAEVSDRAGLAVMAISKLKNWLRLFGAAAGSSLEPRDAVREQLAIDQVPANLDGLRAALRRAAPEQVVAIALDNADARVLTIAAEEVARQPKLLNGTDVTSPPGQEIWALAIGLNADAWRGPSDPHGALIATLQSMLDGKPVSMKLITALSTAPIADLSDYPRRSEVWQHLVAASRDNLLTATATGWIERACSGEIPYTPDPVLEAAIVSGDRLDRALRTIVTTGARTVFSIVAALPLFDEHRFLRWLQEPTVSRHQWTPADAESLGRLVLNRRWRHVLDRLLDFARAGRTDIKPALRICHEMIGIFTRWSLNLSAVTSDEKWTVFEELAVDLYPTGPDDNELWDRAGGKKWDLQTFGNGRSRWHDAIAQIRRGKGPRPSRLLGEMRRDFPLNDQVRYLASDSDLSSYR
ncbi:effector-associated domain EAD1-containing protein [Sinorhizobium saheli]|nr:effector-associated domain EAD1-containing protein [Sinorhizobium saheli]MQW88689.1 hypothetical protein [Sinorhizobium saheli]